jgi:hypothetical protein
MWYPKEEQFCFGSEVKNGDYQLRPIFANNTGTRLMTLSPADVVTVNPVLVKSILGNSQQDRHRSLNSSSSDAHFTLSEHSFDRHNTLSITAEMEQYLTDEGMTIILNADVQKPRLSIDIKDLQLKEKAQKFELLVLKRRAMLNESNSRAKQVLISLYNDYENVISSSNKKTADMNVLIGKLQKIIDKSFHEIKSLETDKAYQSLSFKVKMRVATFALCTFIIIGLIIYFLPEIFDIKFAPTTTNSAAKLEYFQEIHEKETTSLPDNNQVKRKQYTPQEVTSMIDEYCAKNGVKVWKQRRDKIQKYFKNKKLSNWEAQNLLLTGITE